MADVKIYSKEGFETGTIALPEKVFDLPWNANLVHGVATAERSNRRAGTAHTKGRGEVRGGGKKPWKQKGTGRARHGSIRSPIWIGGGVTHGPSSRKDYSKKINKKTKRKALLVALSQKLRDREIVVLDSLTLDAPKTKKGAEILKNLSKVSEFKKLTAGASVFVLTPAADRSAFLAFRNIEGASVKEARNLNVLDALSSQYIIMPKESLEVIARTFG